MSIVLKTPSNGSVTLAEQDTASNVTVTIPARTASVMLDGPAFSAYQTTAQTLANATFTKIDFQAEEFDTNSNFASSRFTPTVAGYYQASAGIYVGTTTGAVILVLFKNGAAWKRISATASPNNASYTAGSALVYLNGSTDYIEIYGFQNSGVSATFPFSSLPDLYYFQAAMVRSAT